jgi:predicted transcriptional regulator
MRTSGQILDDDSFTQTPWRAIPMQTIQQIVHDIADHLPEQATWDDVMYTVYVRQKIEEGLKDIEEGRTISHEDAVQELLGNSKT